MHRKASHHLRQFLFFTIAVLIVGTVIGEVAWTLVIFLSIYLIWTLRQALRLYEWLYERRVEAPPESTGLWGDMLDGIHQLQKNHQKARDRQQAMINRIQESANALKDAVIMTNSHGAMDWWNQAAEQMLGFQTPTDRGQLLYNLVRTPEFKPYFTSKDYKDPLIIDSPHNPDVKLQIQITLFAEDDRLIIVQNITRIVHLEQMRKDFVSNVSHELKTPLTVISGYLETLLDYSEGLPKRVIRALDQMQLQSKRMDALINDLLLLSKIENEGLSFEPTKIDITSLLKTICHDAKSLNVEKQHDIQLSIETDNTIFGHPTQLQSAFSNLLLNAVKYSPAKGKIQVRWYEDNRGLYFSVTDTGIGIDPIHIPRLTERFYRADPSRTSETGGTGLGLAIVKHVLINHQATLVVNSELGVGSTFCCCFPFSQKARC